MATKTTTKQNTSYKTVIGVVPTLDNLIPEEGATVFNQSDKALYYSDGITWLILGPQAAQSNAISLTHAGPIPVSVTADTPIQVDFFDTVQYNLGTAFTESIPSQNVTINTTGDYSYYMEFNLSADVPNVLFKYYPTFNGVRQLAREQTLGAKDSLTLLTFQFGTSFTATDIITVEIEADKTCNLTGEVISTGIILLS